MANKYSGLLEHTRLLGRELINILIDPDPREADEIRLLATRYQELADRVQALVIAEEVYK